MGYAGDQSIEKSRRKRFLSVSYFGYRQRLIITCLIHTKMFHTTQPINEHHKILLEFIIKRLLNFIPFPHAELLIFARKQKTKDIHFDIYLLSQKINCGNKYLFKKLSAREKVKCEKIQRTTIIFIFAKSNSKYLHTKSRYSSVPGVFHSALLHMNF